MLDAQQSIEAIEEGDGIWAYDVHGETSVLRTVKHVMETTATSLLSVHTDHSRIKGVTQEHPFYNVELDDWVKAGELQEGDTLLFGHEDDVFTDRITHIERTALRQPIPVYNLSVAGPEQNYFAEGILVHNKSVQSDYLWSEITDPIQNTELTEGEYVFRATVSLYLMSGEYDDLNMTLNWSLIDVETGSLLPIEGCQDLVRTEPELEEECTTTLEAGEYELQLSVVEQDYSSQSSVIFSVVSQ